MGLPNHTILQSQLTSHPLSQPSQLMVHPNKHTANPNLSLNPLIHGQSHNNTKLLLSHQRMVHQSKLRQSKFTMPPRSQSHIKHPLSHLSMRLPRSPPMRHLKSLSTIHHHHLNANPTNPSLHLGQHINIGLGPQTHLHQNRHIKRMHQSMYQHPITSTNRQSSSIKVLPHQYMSMRNHLVGTAQLLKPKA